MAKAKDDAPKAGENGSTFVVSPAGQAEYSRVMNWMLASQFGQSGVAVGRLLSGRAEGAVYAALDKLQTQ